MCEHLLAAETTLVRTPRVEGGTVLQTGERGARGGITKRKLQGGEIFFHLDVRERDGSVGVVCRCGVGGGE